MDGSDPYNPLADKCGVGCCVKVFKFGNPPAGANMLYVDDAPQAANGLTRPVMLKDQFEDFVMFKPEDPHNKSIYVTIGLVTWNVDANVGWFSSVITQSNNYGPFGPASTNAFPTWTITRH